MDMDYKEAFKKHLKFHYEVLEWQFDKLQLLEECRPDYHIIKMRKEAQIQYMHYILEPSYRIFIDLFPEKKDKLDSMIKVYKEKFYERFFPLDKNYEYTLPHEQNELIKSSYGQGVC